MGLNHWGQSDNAADFKYSLEKKLWEIVLITTETQREIQDLIDSELLDEANNYNTPGAINIALLVEDGIIPLEALSPNQKDYIATKLGKYIKTWDPKHKEDLKRLRKLFTSSKTRVK